jgi:phosphoribosylformylglycinamidine synthase
VNVRVETSVSPLSADLVAGEILRVPVKHGEGQFVASAGDLDRIERDGLVVFRYCSPEGATEGPTGDAHNPNGASNSIAGLRNEAGNVVGLMPHPEHAVDPDVGETGGQPMFASLLSSTLARVSAA